MGGGCCSRGNYITRYCYQRVELAPGEAASCSIKGFFFKKPTLHSLTEKTPLLEEDQD